MARMPPDGYILPYFLPTKLSMAEMLIPELGHYALVGEFQTEIILMTRNMIE